jgi:hypothetical protein
LFTHANACLHPVSCWTSPRGVTPHGREVHVEEDLLTQLNRLVNISTYMCVQRQPSPHQHPVGNVCTQLSYNMQTDLPLCQRQLLSQFTSSNDVPRYPLAVRKHQSLLVGLVDGQAVLIGKVSRHTDTEHVGVWQLLFRGVLVQSRGGWLPRKWHTATCDNSLCRQATTMARDKSGRHRRSTTPNTAVNSLPATKPSFASLEGSLHHTHDYQ